MSVSGNLALLTVTFAFALPVYAQEPIPDPEPEPPEARRIVDERPPLYSFKRAIHPLTWLELPVRPLFRSAENENGRIHGLLTRRDDSDKTSGVRYGLGSLGAGSGAGPLVTLFHKNFLETNVDVEVPLLYTYRRYEAFSFGASTPVAARKFGDRFKLNLGASYSSRPEDNFFGIGNESPRDETHFRTVNRQISARFTTKINGAWTSGVEAVYSRVGVTRPQNGDSTQSVFDDSVPGLFSGAIIRSVVFSIKRGALVRENNSYKGGVDNFEVSFNDSPGSSRFEYWRYHFDTRRFFQ